MQANRWNIRCKLRSRHLPGDHWLLDRAGDVRLRIHSSVNIRQLRGEHGEGREIRQARIQTTIDLGVRLIQPTRLALRLQRPALLQSRAQGHARIRAGYDAPFPAKRFQAGARAFPALVPTERSSSFRRARA